MKERILLSGASGFVGRYVTTELLKRGCSVIGTGRSWKESVAFPESGNFSFIPYEICKGPVDKDLYSFFGRPDRVIHLAWGNLPFYESMDHENVVLPSHKNFLFNLISNGLRRLTVGGTCMEYGMQEGELNEDQPVFPANPYAKAKNDLRLYLESLEKDYAFTLSWVRMFYMYGEGQNPKSLHSQLMKAIRDGAKEFDMSPGDQLRDFLPVEKMAEYIVSITLQDRVTGLINCCSGKPISVEQFVYTILASHNASLILNKGRYTYSKLEPRHFWGSAKKLETILNNGAN
jgi:dTDP-6-deoxy-L-talose 4-dehydrogenase (NAD+)